jgi:molybdate transport system ATP-binding protein
VGITNIFQGVIAGHDAASNRTWIDWPPYRLETRHQPALQPGDKVDWVMPSAFIVLHRKDRPSRGEHENPVSGTVTELVRLGEYSQVDIAITSATDRTLRFTVPTHVANRNALAPGAAASVSLLGEGIHVIARGT